MLRTARPTAAALLLALALLPAAAAQAGAAMPPGLPVPTPVMLPAGAIVGLLDPDQSPLLSALGAQGPCFVDDDASGGYTPGEPVYLDVDSAACGAASRAHDVRLTANAGFPAGSLVARGDADHNAPGLPVPNDDLAFYDANGDGAWGPGDTLYLDLTGAGLLVVGVGDLRLTAFGAMPFGSIVAAGDADVNRPLAEFAPAVDLADAFAAGFLDVDGDATFGPGDVLYVNPDGPVVVPLLGADNPASNDVRLTPLGPYPAGSMVGGLDPDPVSQYRVPGVPGAILGNLCAIDDDGDGAYDAGEALLFDVDAACAGAVEGNDLRLLPNAGMPAGTVVRRGDADFDAPVIGPINDDLRFFDDDGDGVVGPGDGVYIDVMNPGLLVVDVGDLRITPLGALPGLRAVRDGDPDVSRPLAEIGAGVDTADPNVLAYLDTTNDARFDPGDWAYLNIDAGAFPEYVAPGDVRLMGLMGLLPPGSIAGSADPDVAPTLSVAGLAPNPCGVDDDGDGAYNAGEPLYLDVDAACATAVEVNDLRLLPVGSHPGGSAVRRVDGDLGSPVVGPLNDDVLFFDRDGDGVFGPGDTAYLDLFNVGALRVDVGDVRLVAFGALPGLSAVRAGDADENQALAEFPLAQGGARDLADAGAVGYYDTDADGAYSPPDALYLPRLPVAFLGPPVAIGDVRLSPLAALALLPPGARQPGQPGEPVVQEEELPAGGEMLAMLQQLTAQNAQLGARLDATLAEGVRLGAQLQDLGVRLGAMTEEIAGLQERLGGLHEENQALAAKLDARAAEQAGKDTPGPGLVLLVLGILGAAALRGRGRVG